jgi:hypothetical protein
LIIPPTSKCAKTFAYILKNVSSAIPRKRQFGNWTWSKNYIFHCKLLTVTHFKWATNLQINERSIKTPQFVAMIITHEKIKRKGGTICIKIQLSLKETADNQRLKLNFELKITSDFIRDSNSWKRLLKKIYIVENLSEINWRNKNNQWFHPRFRTQDKTQTHKK